MNLNQSNLRKKFATLLTGALLLSSMATMGFSTILAKDVNLIIEGEPKKVITYSKTVEEFLESEKIKLNNKEVVTPSMDTEIQADMDIIITAPKSYKIKDGKSILITRALGETVGEVLSDLNIKLNPDDVVSPKVFEKIDPKEMIVIQRVRKELERVESKIDFETEKVENNELFEGENKVIQKGEQGIKVEDVQHTFVNDELVSIDVIKTEVSKEAINEKIEVGTKKAPKIEGLEGKKVKKVIVMEATAYDPTAGSLTAIGTRARVGAVAVDPRVIPLGSKLYIESMDGFSSYGYATAEDTGGAIKGKRIDLFYNTNAQARKFGRRNVKVYVLD